MRKIIITDHAVMRYRERINDVAPDAARDEIECLILAAKPKHQRRLKKTKNTAIIPTPTCFLIVSHGKIVSIVKELRQHFDKNEAD